VQSSELRRSRSQHIWEVLCQGCLSPRPPSSSSALTGVAAFLLGGVPRSPFHSFCFSDSMIFKPTEFFFCRFKFVIEPLKWIFFSVRNISAWIFQWEIALTFSVNPVDVISWNMCIIVHLKPSRNFVWSFLPPPSLSLPPPSPLSPLSLPSAFHSWGLNPGFLTRKVFLSLKLCPQAPLSLFCISFLRWSLTSFFFCPGWPQIWDHLASVCWEAWVTGTNHCIQSSSDHS
jgi:hypothetical protein